MNGPKSVTANFIPQVAAPSITWAAPAPILFGSALGPLQLNASANVPGTFVYSPSAGYVPTAGNAFRLSVIFTPADTKVSPITASVSIDVQPATNAALSLTKVLTRDITTGNVVTVISISNTGTLSAGNVVLTAAAIGSTSGTPLPAAVSDIPGNSTRTVRLTFPGSVGLPGALAALTIQGTYTGGTINYASRIALP